MHKNLVRLSILVILCLLSSNLKAQLGERIRINGYSSFEFEKQFGDEGKGDPNGSFDADLFDLVFNVQATDRLRIAVDITWEHGVASEDIRGNAAIEYAFPEFTIRDWFKIRAGKMFVPFGIYNEIHTAKPAFLTVKEPLSTNKPHKFGLERRFYPRWANGISVLGNSNINEIEFDYNLQISNGEQENTNPFEEDNNKQKAVAGRVRFATVRDLKFGASFYTDSITELDVNDEDSGNRARLWSFGSQLEWRIKDFGFEFEYTGGTYNPTNAEKETSHALSLLASYTSRERFTPYVRFEFLEPNTKIEDDYASMLIYGLNAEIDDGLFLKAEMNMINAGINNNLFSGVGYTEFKFAIAVGF